jgi:hypothetical protein
MQHGREGPQQREPSARESTRCTALALLGWWAVLFGVWLVLVDSLAHPEVAAGPLAAALAGIAALGIRTHSRVLTTHDSPGSPT